MDYIDEFVDGIDGACKAAGLSDREEFAVVGAIAQALREGVDKQGAQEDWKDKIYRHVLQIPAPVLAGGLSALASVPLTAMFGRRDANGRKHYMRNAIIAGSLGAAVPVALPGVGPIGRFNADRQYRNALNFATEQNKKMEQSFATAGAGLQPGAPGTPEAQRFLDYHKDLAKFRDQYVDPVTQAAGTYGDPASRWKYLLKPIPKAVTETPTAADIPPLAFPDYEADYKRMRGL